MYVCMYVLWWFFERNRFGISCCSSREEKYILLSTRWALPPSTRKKKKKIASNEPVLQSAILNMFDRVIPKNISPASNEIVLQSAALVGCPAEQSISTCIYSKRITPPTEYSAGIALVAWVSSEHNNKKRATFFFDPNNASWQVHCNLRSCGPSFWVSS